MLDHFKLLNSITFYDHTTTCVSIFLLVVTVCLFLTFSLLQAMLQGSCLHSFPDTTYGTVASQQKGVSVLLQKSNHVSSLLKIPPWLPVT